MGYKKRGSTYYSELQKLKHELKCSQEREEINARKIQQLIAGNKSREEHILRLTEENNRLRSELQNEKFCNG